ncbi:MAG TPA: hypothetical protein VGK90_02265 [Rhizomicrobium sp.]
MINKKPGRRAGLSAVDCNAITSGSAVENDAIAKFTGKMVAALHELLGIGNAGAVHIDEIHLLDIVDLDPRALLPFLIEARDPVFRLVEPLELMRDGMHQLDRQWRGIGGATGFIRHGAHALAEIAVGLP